MRLSVLGVSRPADTSPPVRTRRTEQSAPWEAAEVQWSCRIICSPRADKGVTGGMNAIRSWVRLRQEVIGACRKTPVTLGLGNDQGAGTWVGPVKAGMQYA